MSSESQPIARRSVRRPLKLAVILLAESDGEKIQREAYTSDLSEHGLRVQTDVALSPGQIVQVLPCNGLEYAMPGRVIWVGEPRSDEAGEAGLEFLRPLPSTA